MRIWTKLDKYFVKRKATHEQQEFAWELIIKQNNNESKKYPVITITNEVTNQ